MEKLIYLIGSGISWGAILGLGAVGFVVIYKATGIFNIAHGALMAMGAFFAATMGVMLGLPMWLSFLLACVMAGILGLVLEWIAIRPLIGQSLLAIVMVTVAALLILEGITMLIWGATGYTYPELIIPGVPSLVVGAVEFDSVYVVGLIISVAVIATVSLYFRYTRMGLSMRATAEDEQLAESMGVEVRKTYAYAWTIGALCAGIGGIIYCSISYVNYMVGAAGLAVLPVAIFGGLTSIPGAIVAGVIIGLASNLAGGYTETFLPAFKSVFPYIIMLIVLVFLPYGLFGEKRIERI